MNSTGIGAGTPARISDLIEAGMLQPNYEYLKQV